MPHHAVVLGASGAVGSALVRELLASSYWRTVTIFVRRPTTVFDALPGADKLVTHVSDLEEIESESAIELTIGREGIGGPMSAFCTLGVGQPRKVSRATFHHVDVEIASAFARGCRVAGVRDFSLLTAAGANPRSRVTYARVKGEIESAVRALQFARTSFFRPSLLVTRELRYGLQDRIAQWSIPKISPLLPSRFHEIRVEDLATAMRVNAERDEIGAVEVLHYEDFVRLLNNRQRPNG